MKGVPEISEASSANFFRRRWAYVCTADHTVGKELSRNLIRGFTTKSAGKSARPTQTTCPTQLHFEHDLAIVLAFFEQLVGFDGAVEGKHMADLRREFSLVDPCGELLPRWFHDLALLR